MIKTPTLVWGIVSSSTGNVYMRKSRAAARTARRDLNQATLPRLFRGPYKFVRLGRSK